MKYVVLLVCVVSCLYWEVDGVSLFSLKEGVGEGQAGHPSHCRIIVELGINVEEHWHVHLKNRV